jgi:hypothetical protein
VKRSLSKGVLATWGDHLVANGLRIRKVTTEDPLYPKILSLRAAAYRLPEAGSPCPVDAYSVLWALESSSGLLGSIRMTPARWGTMDCEAHFPSWLRSDFPGITGSSSRFCVLPGVPPALQCAKILTDFACADAIDHGVYCDVIDVREGAVPYYRRVGYRPLRQFRFIHPLFHTRSRVMVAVAHPHFRGRLGRIWSAKAPCEVVTRLMERLEPELE